MRRLSTVLVLLAIAAPVYAEVSPAVTDAVKKVKAADYPSANALTILSDQNVVFQADGKFVITVHIARMALTNTGTQEIAATTNDYAKDAEKLEVLSAQVVKKDGTIIPVDKKDIQDVEQSGDANIYDPEGRAVKVTFHGIAVGDAVDYTYRLTRSLPTRDNYWNDTFGFQSTEPMLEASYNVDGPTSLPLTAEVYHGDRGGKITSSKKTVGDRIHYTWSVTNAPQLMPEMAMDASVELPMLVVTTDPSWQHFSKWWADLTEKQMVATDELKAKVKELTKNAKTDDDKIKALYDFVAQDIRYRGLGVGPRTGYTPRKAAETYASRWGVCRDVSILLTTMLRADGLEAYPVLTNVGDPVLPKIAYDGFNHAIVAMPKKGGGWSYLDPTAKNNNSLIPGYEAQQDTLVSTPKGEPLTQIPAIDPSANLGHATATTVIADDGTMTSKITLQTKGMFDLIIRSVAAMASEDQQKEAVEQLLRNTLPGSQLVSYSISSAIALWSPMQISFEIKMPHAATKTGDYRLLRTVVTSGALGLVENMAPQLLGLQSRKYTLDSHLTFQYDEDETVKLPPSTKVVALPNDAKSATKVTTLAATCTQQDPTTITCHRTFQLKSRFVDPDEYKNVRTALASLSQVARQPVILSGVN